MLLASLASYAGISLFYANYIYRRNIEVLVNAPEPLKTAWKSAMLKHSLLWGALWPLEPLRSPTVDWDPCEYMYYMVVASSWLEHEGVRYKWRRNAGGQLYSGQPKGTFEILTGDPNSDLHARIVEAAQILASRPDQ